jgi:hypothetical protein
MKMVKKDIRNDVEYLIKQVAKKYALTDEEAWTKIYFHACKLLTEG